VHQHGPPAAVHHDIKREGRCRLHRQDSSATGTLTTPTTNPNHNVKTKPNIGTATDANRPDHRRQECRSTAVMAGKAEIQMEGGLIGEPAGKVAQTSSCPRTWIVVPPHVDIGSRSRLSPATWHAQSTSR